MSAAATPTDTSTAKSKLPARLPPTQIGPSDSGIGHHWRTQVISAVSFLKTHGHPIRLEDLALLSGVEALLSNAELLSFFRSHEKVVWDDRTGLFSYKPEYDIKSKFDLENLIIRYSTRGGLSVKKLRESWSNVVQAIEELEKEGKIFVTRTGGSLEREGTMKAIFRNELGEPKMKELKQVKISEEFLTLWKGLKAPTKEELSLQLAEAGLTTNSSATDLPKSNQGKNQKGKGRKGANRRVKLTNTHLKGTIDLSKDYVVPGR